MQLKEVVNPVQTLHLGNCVFNLFFLVVDY